MLNELLNGMKPGTAEWTENRLYGQWYREQGDWAALLYPGEGDHNYPRWDVYVWLHRYGILETPRNRQVFECVPSGDSLRHDPGSLERAKRLADAMLAKRAPGAASSASTEDGKQ